MIFLKSKLYHLYCMKNPSNKKYCNNLQEIETTLGISKNF